jgi:hypothetical protein
MQRPANLVKTCCRALGKTRPKRLDRSADVIDEPSSRADHYLARADERQVRLRCLSPMLQRPEQLGVYSGKTSQLLGIQPVGLAPLAIDQSRLARVGHQDPVVTLFEHSAHPRRVGSHLNSDCHPLLGAKAPPEGLRGGTQPTLLDHLAALLVDEAEVGILVAQIHSGCQQRCSSATIIHGPILLPF